MSFLGIGMVAAPIIGGIIGNVAGAADRNAARREIAKGIAELQAAGMPPDTSLPLIFEKFQDIGIMTPELEEDVQIAASEVAQMQERPEGRNLALEAINIFKQGTRGGVGLEERAAFNQLRQEEQQQLKSALDASRLAAQRSGATGAGIANELMNIQASADRGALGSERIMAMIAGKVRENAANLSSAADRLRSQDYQADLERARAADERNRFIASNAMSREARNVEALRQKQQREEDLKMKDVAVAQQERLRQVDAQRQYWKDKMDRATTIANARAGQATQLQNQAARTEKMWSDMGSGVGGFLKELI